MCSLSHTAESFYHRISSRNNPFPVSHLFLGLPPNRSCWCLLTRMARWLQCGLSTPGGACGTPHIALENTQLAPQLPHLWCVGAERKRPRFPSASQKWIGALLTTFFRLSCRYLSRGWRNQVNLGIVPQCSQSKLQTSHSSVHQHQGLLREFTDELSHASNSSRLRKLF